MKKILSLLLLLTILMQLFSFTVCAEDVAIRGETEIEFIRRLNIIGTWEATDIITRAEFVNAAIRCVIKNSGAKDSGTIINAPSEVFSDVKADYWAAYNIDIAKKGGIISGNENGQFDPEGYLSYPAALKIALNVLGYAPAAEQKGGFPTGYILTANKIEIGLPYVANSNIMTKGEAAIILKNMLETAPMQQVYNVGSTESYMPSKDEDTLLNKTFNIRSFSGIVTSNQYSSVDSTQNTDVGMVRIKSISNGRSANFEIGETKADDFLGRCVTVYYYDDIVHRLFHVEAEDGKELVINGDELISASYNKREITYKLFKETDGEKVQSSEKSIKIPLDINIIHNGIFTGDVKGIFDILSGNTVSNLEYIAFYDNDNDSKYDVVKINSYYTLHADYVYDDEDRLVITDSTITDKSLSPLSIDKTKTGLFVKRYTSDGYNMDEYAIIEGDTIGVSIAKGNVELYSLYISKNIKSDIIKAVSGKKLLSDGHTYNLSNSLLKHYENKDLSKIINFEQEYDLYIDHNGFVSAFYSKRVGFDDYYDIIKNKDDFIYILDTYKDDSGLGANVIHFKVVNLEAEISEMISDEKLTIDGALVKNGGVLDFDTAMTKVKGKLVKYTKGTNGRIKTITLPASSTTDNEFSYTVGLNQDNGPVQLKYYSGPKTFYKKGNTTDSDPSNDGGTCSIDSKTTILWVPDDAFLQSGIDVGLYCKRGTVSNFAADADYIINSYKVNNSSVAADILIAYYNNRLSSGKYDSYTSPIIVREVRKSINKYGEQGTKICGMQNKKEVEIVSAESEFKTASGLVVNVEPGDIVQCALNVKGDCIALSTLYSPSSYTSQKDTSFNAKYRTMKASVYHHDSSTSALLVIKDEWDIADSDIITDNMETYIIPSAAVIYLFDAEDQTLSTASSGMFVDYKFDSENYSKIVVRTEYGKPTIIVIYE